MKTALIVTAFLLLPSVGVIVAGLIALALDRHRDRQWLTHLPTSLEDVQ